MNIKDAVLTTNPLSDNVQKDKAKGIKINEEGGVEITDSVEISEFAKKLFNYRNVIEDIRDKHGELDSMTQVYLAKYRNKSDVYKNDVYMSDVEKLAQCLVNCMEFKDEKFIELGGDVIFVQGWHKWVKSIGHLGESAKFFDDVYKLAMKKLGKDNL